MENAPAKNLTPQGKPRTCGFRFSTTDAIVLLTGAIGVAMLAEKASELALLIGFTVGHFFLFCNIFRVRRGPEVIWSLVFLLNAVLSLQFDLYSFLIACLVQLPLTAYLLYRETRMPYYHGVFCHRWNREDIDGYLRGD